VIHYFIYSVRLSAIADRGGLVKNGPNQAAGKSASRKPVSSEIETK
jgi:hypothetical protein